MFFLQIESLLKLCPFITEITPVINDRKKIIDEISEGQWIAYAELVTVHKFAHTTTVSMQKEQYATSDFFGDWTELKLQLKQIQHIQIVKDLLNSIMTREKGLIDAPTVLASVYVDPRFTTPISHSQAIESYT